MSGQQIAIVDSILSQLSGYRYAQFVKQHVVHVVSMINSLSPKIGTMTFEANKTSTQMCLQGTIPMYYKGSRYNIPMNIWIPEMYPYAAPYAYVTPTDNMMIKERHKHVDNTGRCYLPYLAEWNPQKCNLYELVNQLSSIFAGDPPVYQKASTSPSTTNLSSSYVQPSPSPNTAMMGASGMYASQPAPSGNMMPYPSNAVSNYPNPMSQSMTNVYNPPQQPQPQPQRGSYPAPVPAPSPYPPTQQQPPNPYQNHQQSLVQLNQKIQRKVGPFVREYAQKMEHEMDLQTKLEMRSKNLEQTEQRIAQDYDKFVKSLAEVEDKERQVADWVDKNKSKEIDIDKAIEPQNAFSKQILECMAQDSAIDDLMYYLDKALQSEIIDLETYLKNVRQYAREQFLSRALLKKVFAAQQQATK